MKITIKIMAGDAVVRGEDGEAEAASTLTIGAGEAYDIVSPTGSEWKAMVCNEGAAGAPELWAEIRDDTGEPWDLHTLKPHGAGWRTGWSVVLEGDAGDIGRVYVPASVVPSSPAPVTLPIVGVAQ